MPAVAVLAVRALAALWAPLAAVMMAVPAIIIGLNIHTLHSPMRASTRSERGSSSSQQQQHKQNQPNINKQQQSKRNVSFKTEHKAKRKFSLARVFKRLNEIQNNLNKNNINNYTSCLITITTKTTTK